MEMTDRPVIPYVSLDRQWSSEQGQLLPIIQRVLSAGNYVGGDEVDELESELAEYHGAPYAVALNSGTDALVCGLAALGVRKGDEVITPPNSFVASTAAIYHLGAVPVFCDVESDQMISAESVRRRISKKTRAIMPVHLTGRMAEMDKLTTIAEDYAIPIIEDSAQAIGSRFLKRLSGTYGKVGCFSTHPLKNLNACGDGGFVITSDEYIYKTIRLMRSHGLRDRNIVEEFGYVSRMDVLQAAILRFRLKNLSAVIERRRANAELYRRLLDKDNVFFPEEDDRYFSTYHTFVIQVDRRDELQNFLSDQGVGTAIHYPIPIHLQPAYKKRSTEVEAFPMVESQAKKILSLPINQFVSAEEVTYICERVNAFFR